MSFPLSHFLLKVIVNVLSSLSDKCREGGEGERPSLCVSDSLSRGETDWGQHWDQGEAESSREEVGGARQRTAAGNHRAAEEERWAGGAEEHRGPSEPLTGYNQPLTVSAQPAKVSVSVSVLSFFDLSLKLIWVDQKYHTLQKTLNKNVSLTSLCHL